MAEALSLHMENEEILKKSKNQLEMSNRQLVAEKELNQQLVQEKVAQARLHKKQIKELQVRQQPSWYLVGGGGYSGCGKNSMICLVHNTS